MTSCLCRFFFSGSASTPIYTLSLHDALPTLHQARLQPAAAGPELVARGDGEDQFREYSNVLLAGLKLTVSLWLTPAWKFCRCSTWYSLIFCDGTSTQISRSAFFAGK